MSLSIFLKLKNYLDVIPIDLIIQNQLNSNNINKQLYKIII